MTILVTTTFSSMFIVKSVLVLVAAISTSFVVYVLLFALLEIFPSIVLTFYILPPEAISRVFDKRRGGSSVSTRSNISSGDSQDALSPRGLEGAAKSTKGGKSSVATAGTSTRGESAAGKKKIWEQKWTNPNKSKRSATDDETSAETTDEEKVHDEDEKKAEPTTETASATGTVQQSSGSKSASASASGSASGSKSKSDAASGSSASVSKSASKDS